MKTEQKHTKINPIINPNTKPQVQTTKRFKPEITNSTQKERKKKSHEENKSKTSTKQEHVISSPNIWLLLPPILYKENKSNNKEHRRDLCMDESFQKYFQNNSKSKYNGCNKRN